MVRLVMGPMRAGQGDAMRAITQARKCRVGCRSGVSRGWGIRNGGKVIKGENRGVYVGTK